ncbi:MAG: hypothetical protein AAF490_04120 [Chloroflexota bacterium]
MSVNQVEKTAQKNSSGLFVGLKEYLDEAFLPLGFQRFDGDLGAVGNVAGANYIWEQNGRTIKVHCSRRSRTLYIGEIRTFRYVGHSLSFTVTTPVKTRLSVLTTGGFSKLLMKFASRWNKHVELTDLLSASHLQTWAIDESWTQDFLSNTAVKSGINALIPEENIYRSARIGFSPHSFNFLAQMNIREITPERVAGFFDAINAILDAAEANPPVKEIEKSWMEQQSPKTVAAIWVGGFLAIPVLLMGVMCACITTFLIVGAAASGG